MATAMRGQGKRCPAAGDFLFEIDAESLAETCTAWGGVPPLVRAIRSLDVPGSLQRHLHIKQRERVSTRPPPGELCGADRVGGDCLEDFDQLREDAGLAQMLGHAIPVPWRRRSFSISFTPRRRSSRRSGSCRWAG
jgi:hypothetical protein